MEKDRERENEQAKTRRNGFNWSPLIHHLICMRFPFGAMASHTGEGSSSECFEPQEVDMERNNCLDPSDVTCRDQRAHLSIPADGNALLSHTL